MSDIQTRYILISTETTTCPDCRNHVQLLCPDMAADMERLPAFYICPRCGRVSQVGVGHIPLQRTGEIE